VTCSGAPRGRMSSSMREAGGTRHRPPMKRVRELEVEAPAGRAGRCSALRRRAELWRGRWSSCCTGPEGRPSSRSATPGGPNSPTARGSCSPIRRALGATRRDRRCSCRIRRRGTTLGPRPHGTHRRGRCRFRRSAREDLVRTHGRTRAGSTWRDSRTAPPWRSGPEPSFRAGGRHRPVAGHCWVTPPPSARPVPALMVFGGQDPLNLPTGRGEDAVGKRRVPPAGAGVVRPVACVQRLRRGAGGNRNRWRAGIPRHQVRARGGSALRHRRRPGPPLAGGTAPSSAVDRRARKQPRRRRPPAVGLLQTHRLA